MKPLSPAESAHRMGYDFGCQCGLFYSTLEKAIACRECPQVLSPEAMLTRKVTSPTGEALWTASKEAK